MRTIIRLAIDANAVKVVEILNLEALTPALIERQINGGPDALRARIFRCATRAVGIQERIFRHGIQRAEPLLPGLLDADSPGVANALVKHADLEVFGEIVPASILFQKPVSLRRGGVRAQIALTTSLLEILVEDPFASDSILEARLSETYAGITLSTARAIREELGIPSSVLRFDPASMLLLAMEKVATTRWLRERLRSHLQVDRKLAACKLPWPAWWSATQVATGSPGRIAYAHQNELRIVSEGTFDIARGTWERFSELAGPARDAEQVPVLADLLARLASRHAPSEQSELSILLAVAVATGSFPEPLDGAPESLDGKNLLDMLRLAPPDEWSVVLERIERSGEELDNLLVDALAEGMA